LKSYDTPTKADRDLSLIKELAGKGDHAVDEVSFDDGAADFAFAAWIRRGHSFGAILAQDFFGGKGDSAGPPVTK